MEAETRSFHDDGGIPNSPQPIRLYRGVAGVADGAASAEALFARHGWSGAWRDGIYPFHHFHSTAHEVLAIAAGDVQVLLGGPGGETFFLEVGDVVVLPAGTGHCNEGCSADLLVVGAYDGGRDWDTLRGDPAEHDAALERIRAVPDPGRDPVTGEPY